MKKFIILGTTNPITYKDIFTLVKECKIFTGKGVNLTLWFQMNPKAEKYEYVDEQGNKIGGIMCTWWQNVKNIYTSEFWPLQKYEEGKHQKYDNIDAINVDRATDIPDYDGLIGVPISFIKYFCPQQFELVGITKEFDMGRPLVNGEEKYARLVLKLKKYKQGSIRIKPIKILV